MHPDHAGSRGGLKARCFISNLGLEPVYVVDVLITLSGGDKRHNLRTEH